MACSSRAAGLLAFLVLSAQVWIAAEARVYPAWDGRHLQQAGAARTSLKANKAINYVDQALQGYYTNAQLETALKGFASRCKAVARLFSIGKSVKGVPLWVLEISNQLGVKEAKPNFKYIANMHGDETGGRQLLLALAEWLCANHKSDATAKRAVEGMHLYLMPTMNPDGYALKRRENARGVDLNRDFPDPLATSNLKVTGREQPETKAVMDWTLATGFVASANMHEGDAVVNYPYDGNVWGTSAENKTQDDAAFRHLALSYSLQNPRMLSNSEFDRGITNGAAWYSINGGMQDWNYVWARCFEMTLELYPNKGQAPLKTLWNENRQAMLQLALAATLGGVRGQVVKKAANGTLQPLEASIAVKGQGDSVRSDPKFGAFFRPLEPGTHTLQVTATGYPTKEVSVVVPDDAFNITSIAGVAVNVTFP